MKRILVVSQARPYQPQRGSISVSPWGSGDDWHIFKLIGYDHMPLSYGHMSHITHYYLMV